MLSKNLLLAALISTFSVLVLAAAPTSSYAAFTLEPATGSLWIVNSGPFQKGIDGEWRRDGSFTPLVSPFSPFGANYGGFFTGLEGTVIAGEFVMISNFERAYRRSPRGGWDMQSTMALLPPGVSCERHMSSGAKGCLLAPQNDGVKGLGSYFIALGNDAFDSLTLLFDSPNGLRRCQGVECFVTAKDEGDRTLRLGGEHIVVVGEGAGPTLSYSSISASGRQERKVPLPGATATAMSDPEVFAAEGRFYVVNRVSDQMSGHNLSTVYRIDDPASEQPRAVVVTKLVDVELAKSTPNFAVAGPYLYFDAGARNTGLNRAHAVSALDFRTNTVISLSSCPTGAWTYLAGSRSPDEPIWVACGATLMELADGHVVRSLAAAGPVSSGVVLAREGRDSELVLDLYRNRYQRILADGSSHLLDLGAFDGTRKLWPAWEEHGAVCGVPASDTPATPGTVVCQRGDTWRQRQTPAWVPFEVLHVAGSVWALAQDLHQTSLYRLDGQTEAAQWQWVQSWPLLTGSLPRLHQARLLRHGLTDVAVDFGTPEIWVHQGAQFVPAYPHARANVSLRPLIDTAGRLYDGCADQQDVLGNLLLCVYTSDGQIKTAALPASALHNLVPLKEGIEAGGSFATASYGYDSPYLLRGAKTIQLQHMFGQLSGQGVFYSQTYVDGGTIEISKGEAHLSGLKAVRTSTPYTFDGRSLTEHSGYSFTMDFVGFSSRTSNALPARSNNPTDQRTEPAVPTIWQGADGLWRRESTQEEPIYGIGHTLHQVAGKPEASRRNAVRAAAQLHGLVWAANDSGFYACPLENASKLSADTRELTVTAGCRMRMAMPYARALQAIDGQLFALQGGRVVRLRPGPAADGSQDSYEVLSNGNAVTAFHGESQGGQALLAWVEGQQFYWRRVQDAQANSTALPSGLDAAAVHAVSAGFLCTKQGLFSLKDEQWQLLPQVASCKSMATNGGAALVSDGSHAYLCRSSGCGNALAPPEGLLDDTVLGTLRAPAGGKDFAWISGNQVYRLRQSEFVGETPLYAAGSALLTKSVSCEDGVLALNGGGVLVQGHAGEAGEMWQHVRLQ